MTLTVQGPHAAEDIRVNGNLLALNISCECQFGKGGMWEGGGERGGLVSVCLFLKNEWG